MAKRKTKKKAKSKKWSIIFIVLALAILAALFEFVPGFEDALYNAVGIQKINVSAAEEISASTKVHVIDVGQGSATLLEQNGQYALIDAGPPEGKDNLLGYLNSLGVQTLEYVIMTHPHADHIAAMPEILEQFSVNCLVLPDFEKAPLPTTSLFEKVLQSAQKNNISTKTAKIGDIYPLGNGTITILQDGLTTSDNYNLLSLISIFEADGMKTIITGDAEKSNEKSLLETGQDLSADVFVAGHHGSSTSNTENFVKAINPAVVAISCGKDNSYGHPHREPLEIFDEVGAVVLRTDLNGNIVIGKSSQDELQYAVTAS